MFNCTTSISENSQLVAEFSGLEEYDICDEITIEGYKLCITSKQNNGIIWQYKAETCPDFGYEIVSPHKGNITLRALLNAIANDIDVDLDLTKISSYIPLNSIVYSGLLSQGTAEDVLSNLCDIYALSWWLYWAEDSLLPKLVITYKATNTIDSYDSVLAKSETKSYAAQPHISVITLPEITSSDSAVLGDGNTEFEPSTQEFTMPYLEGRAVPLATVKELDPDSGELVDVPFDQWRMLKRELAIANTTWAQKSPIGKWTQEQRDYNKAVRESSDLWPMYWVTENGLTRTLPPEGKVKIIETELDHAEQTKKQALEEYPKLTYILPGKVDVWSWVGVWPDVNRYDARTMPENYNVQRVWRGDKKNNRQTDWDGSDVTQEFKYTLNMSENSQLVADFSATREYEVRDEITIQGYKLRITDKQNDGTVWKYKAKTRPDFSEDIVSPYKGDVKLQALLNAIANDIEVELELLGISSNTPLNTIVYSAFLPRGTAEEVLSDICNRYALIWWLYWKKGSLLPKLIITDKGR